MPVERDDGQCISQDAAQQKRQEQVEQIGSTARLCRPQRIHSVLLEEEGTQGQESKPTLVRLAWPSKILPPRGVRPLSIHRFRIVSIHTHVFDFFFSFSLTSLCLTIRAQRWSKTAARLSSLPWTKRRKSESSSGARRPISFRP